MVEVIKMLKDALLESMEKEVSERGVERLDPDMVDMVKDLACAEKDCWESEYYRSVTEAMDKQGYQDMGYNGQNGYGYRDSMGRYARRGWQNQYGSGYSRRGYDTMGHNDSIEGIRNMVNMANPEEKERMKAELRSMLGM